MDTLVPMEPTTTAIEPVVAEVTAPTSVAADRVADQGAMVEELLVEEISIDGMCGVS